MTGDSTNLLSHGLMNHGLTRSTIFSGNPTIFIRFLGSPILSDPQPMAPVSAVVTSTRGHLRQGAMKGVQQTQWKPSAPSRTVGFLSHGGIAQ